MRFFSDKKAWTEAISDTVIGTLINFPLNLIVLTIAFNFKMSVFTTACFTWVTFTLLAIIRKYIVRVFFSKKIVE